VPELVLALELPDGLEENSGDLLALPDALPDPVPLKFADPVPDPLALPEAPPAQPERAITAAAVIMPIGSLIVISSSFC